MNSLVKSLLFVCLCVQVSAGRRRGGIRIPPFAHVCSIPDGTGRPTEATSTFVFAQQGITASSDLAVDNVFDPNFFNGSCYQSGIGDLMPRWVVDLGSTQMIKSVKILNRDTFPERLSNVTVGIYDEDPIANPMANFTVCGFIPGGVPPSVNVTVSCPYTLKTIILWYQKALFLTGRYVSLLKDGEYLHMCEVVVNTVAKNKVYAKPQNIH